MGKGKNQGGSRGTENEWGGGQKVDSYGPHMFLRNTRPNLRPNVQTRSRRRTLGTPWVRVYWLDCPSVMTHCHSTGRHDGGQKTGGEKGTESGRRGRVVDWPARTELATARDGRRTMSGASRGRGGGQERMSQVDSLRDCPLYCTSLYTNRDGLCVS